MCEMILDKIIYGLEYVKALNTSIKKAGLHTFCTYKNSDILKRLKKFLCVPECNKSKF